jgi:Domain of unknown function (DUF4350)
MKQMPILILLCCGGAFAIGMAALFEMRFERGDVYPPYSSLRADPLGAMAFYESLERIPGLSVERDYSASDRLPEVKRTAYLELASRIWDWERISKESLHAIQDFLANGNRLIITFFPQTGSFDPREGAGQTNSDTHSPAEDESRRMARRRSEAGEGAWVPLGEKWGFQAGFEALSRSGRSYAPAPVVKEEALRLPKALAWHSGLVFKHPEAPWRVIYGRGTNAVVMERHFGKGSVVLASDSYFISNEAMEADRHADLLAWLIGGNTNVVFDEAHFGIMETPGAATLMRKYHLEALAAGLLLLAGLFIWKNSAALVPPLADELPNATLRGKDSASGFVNLLRRSIAPRDLLAVCFAEWKKSALRAGGVSAARIQSAEAVFSSENSAGNQEQDPVAAYKRICAAVATRTKNSTESV